MIGLDLVYVPELEAAMRRRPRFAQRAFTEAEREYCEARPNPAQHYAARFAAKEAAFKALGEAPGWQKMNVVQKPGGAMAVQVEGRAQELPLSLTHSGDYAAAVALAAPIAEQALHLGAR